MSDVLLIIARSIIVYVAGVIYFLPSIVAVRRSKASFLFFYGNLQLGWTGVCWLILLMWACKPDPILPPKQKHPVPSDPTIDIEAIVMHVGRCICASIFLGLVATFLQPGSSMTAH